jgi:predicted ArsR family transcriptional regulator
VEIGPAGSVRPPTPAPEPQIRPGYGPAPPPPDPAALGLSPARADILDRLLVAGGSGLSVAEAARLTALHENTAREHLDALTERGFAERDRQPAQGRGRPAWRYTARRYPSPGGNAAEYATVAAVMASFIARTATDPQQQGLRLGEQWGRDLAERQAGDPSAGPARGRRGHAGARRQLLDLLDNLGFAPHQRAGDDTVLLTRCPLLDIARREPAVVCAMHLGLARSVLASHGGSPVDTELVAFAEPGACHLIVPRSAPAAVNPA